MATVLSVDSQATAAVAAVLAPTLGFVVDAMPPQWRFVPVAVVGLAVAMVGWARPRSADAGTRPTV
jgi:hypothetical protein